MKALRARERNRRRALTEHWINANSDPSDFEQQRAVAEPRDTKSRRHRFRPCRQWVDDWNRDARHALLPAKEEVAHHRRRVALQVRPDAGGVAEAAIAKLPRCQHALATRAVR